MTLYASCIYRDGHLRRTFLEVSCIKLAYLRCRTKPFQRVSVPRPDINTPPPLLKILINTCLFRYKSYDNDMTYHLFGNEDHDFMGLITYHNYTLIELYYQLLADLESGNEERALHIVFEIADTKYVKYAFKLLKRYAARDIGIGDPFAFVLVKSLAESWEKDKKAKAHGGEADRHYLSLAVQYLARANKSKETKWLTQRVNHHRSRGEFFDIDDTTKERAKVYRMREAQNEQ